MKLTMANREMELGGKYLGSLRDSTSLRGDGEALRSRMAEDGYLLIRGLHRPEKVLAARRCILEDLDANEQIDRAAPLLDAVIAEGGRGALRSGRKELTRSEPFLNLVESPEIMGFFADFLQGDVLTFDYKWLRVMGPGAFSGAHYDIVYMGRGTPNLYTCWTPIGDVTYDMGPLAILAGSHRFERIKETYGQMDVDRDRSAGWFTTDPIEMVDRFGGQWQTTEFAAGDAMIFGMFTMHGSLNHASNRYRLSCDTRYQRADEPVDERWIGENPIAHSARAEGETVTMETLRQKWGV